MRARFDWFGEYVNVVSGFSRTVGVSHDHEDNRYVFRHRLHWQSVRYPHRRSSSRPVQVRLGAVGFRVPIEAKLVKGAPVLGRDYHRKHPDAGRRQSHRPAFQRARVSRQRRPPPPRGGSSFRRVEHFNHRSCRRRFVLARSGKSHRVPDAEHGPVKATEALQKARELATRLPQMLLKKLNAPW